MRLRAARRELHGLVDELIANRRATPGEHHDLLALLMAARDDAGDALSDAELRAETLNFIVAGDETTAVALTWTLYLLSLHPLAARQVEDELARVLDGSPPTAAQLSELSYLERVLCESMRLYPPAYAVPRRSVSEDTIDGYRIPAGATVVVAIWLVHHHPAIWNNPEGFDPDRFLPDAIAARDRYAFLPFAAGPHKCIGKPLAMMEAKIILAMVLQRFRLDVPAGAMAEPHPRATLRPKRPIAVRLVPRAARPPRRP